MKKIIAIALTLAMLLLGTAGLAEGAAAVLTVDNIQVSFQGESLSLDGLSGSLALNAADVASLLATVDNEVTGENLLTAVGQLVGQQFLFTIDGLDTAYGASLPSEVGQYSAYLPMLLPGVLPALDSVALPPLGGVTIPTADMSGVVADYITRQDATSADFELSADQTMALLESLLDAASSNGVQVSQIEEARQGLAQLKDQGIGFAVSGAIADNGDSQAVTADVYLAQNGAVMETPFANVNANSYENNFNLVAGVDEGSGMNTVATVALTSDPAAAELSFAANIGGVADIGLDAMQEDGLQKFILHMDTAEEGVDFEFGYGQQGGKDVVMLNLGATGSEAGSFNFLVESAMGGDGVRRGNLTITASMAGESAVIAADLTMYVGQDAIDLGGFTMPENVLPFERISEIGGQMEEVLQPLMNYLNGLDVAA